MAAPNYEQIQSFGNVSQQLKDAAFQEFMERIEPGMSYDEIIAQATEVASKFKMLGMELGAQWYDLCTELAGIAADPAEVTPVDTEAVNRRAHAYADHATAETVQDVFVQFLQNEINESIRTTGNENLWRDYERGLTPGKWARVPVGDTCAWCLMLASQGAWYLTEESALGKSKDHYHDGCNCIAVYHADPDSIKGYGKLVDYKRMYYDADNARRANNRGKELYPDDLKDRIKLGKKKHIEREEKRELEAAERGEEYEKIPWTAYNEDLIVMRYKYGLK